MSPDSDNRTSGRALLIQLARLGDLVQSLPAYSALQQGGVCGPDVLCAASLAPIAELFPTIERVHAWDGAHWRAWSKAYVGGNRKVLEQARRWVEQVAPQPYAVAFNLNQHHRAMAAAHLLASRVVGPGARGAVDAWLPPWARYLREVARMRGLNRVNLADAFCGMCGVRPPAVPPRISPAAAPLPGACEPIGRQDGLWVALVIGAGDTERTIPAGVWTRVIKVFLEAAPVGQVVLVGAGAAERATAQAIQDGLSALELGRVWDTTDRLTLAQLSACLSRCSWVLGADTGPLHLGAALGVKAIGWYIARARVHETGPYGNGHWVWQVDGANREGVSASHSHDIWPVEGTVALLANGACVGPCEGWSLWRSGFDAWGTGYVSAQGLSGGRARSEVWRALASEQDEVAA